MESVMDKIKQARDDEVKRRADTNIKDITVDGCQVRLRFDAAGDSRIIPAIQSMLISSHLNAAFAMHSGVSGGE